MSLSKTSLNIRELRYWTQEVAAILVGAQLQGVHYFSSFLVLDFYATKALQLVFNLSKSAPRLALVHTQKLSFWGIKKTTPVQQYLAAHFKNQRIISFELASHGDRQLEMVFPVGNITVNVIPHAFNIQINHLQKQIFLFKPQEFIPRLVSESQFGIREGLNFSLNEGLEYVTNTPDLTDKSSKSHQSILDNQRDELKKKQQQQLVLEERIQQSVAVNEIIPLQKELAQLIKKIKRLQNLIESPTVTSAGITQKITTQKKELVKNMRQSEAKGRLGEVGGLVYVIGTSGEDSLKLIRQAKAWHWWFHQRQGAGPHLILACDKNKLPSPELQRQVAYQLVEYINKNKKMPGRYEIMATQIRFVRPIKGAKAGLVTYQNATTWQIDYPLV